MELYPFVNQLECYGPCFFYQSVKNNSFWSDVFKANGIFFCKMKPDSTFLLLSETVFYNKNMMIGNKVVKYTQWVDNRVYCIAHFTKEKGSFVLLRNLIQYFLEYNFCTNTTNLRVKT